MTVGAGSRRGAAAALLWATALAAVLVPIAVGAQSDHLQAIDLSKPSVVVVIAVDLRGGELRPMASGSGTIVSGGGAILTNHHVLHDARNGRLHDLFLVGRHRADGRAPELVCAGEPSDGQLEGDLDLALIRCDRDLDGQPWQPEFWPDIPIGDSAAVVPGEQLWVLGYPNAGGGTIGVSAGLVSGWTGEQGGAASRAFMRTDATVSAGNSGGAAVDRGGRLIGVPTAFRVVSADTGDRVAAVGRVGLVRPVEHARGLLAPVLAGRPDPGGVLVTGRVVAAGSMRAVRGAAVLALPAGVTARQLDADGAGDQVLSWGAADATGVFTLEPPLPRDGRYTVAVVAPGYLPVLEDGALVIPAEASHTLMPWRTVRLVRTGSP